MKDPNIAKKFTKEELELFKMGKWPAKYTWHHHQNKGIKEDLVYGAPEIE